MEIKSIKEALDFDRASLYTIDTTAVVKILERWASTKISRVSGRIALGAINGVLPGGVKSTTFVGHRVRELVRRNIQLPVEMQATRRLVYHESLFSVT